MICADDASVACPLFQAEYGGPPPTSALQLRIVPINLKRACELLALWHSTQPTIQQVGTCHAYAAECGNKFYAVAIWGPPIAAAFNFKGYWELRRFAIAPAAPKNTASRMLAVMRRLLARQRPDVKTLITYQNESRHQGTIYRAAGWKSAARRTPRTAGWTNRRQRQRSMTGATIRWELTINPKKYLSPIGGAAKGGACG